MNDTNTLQESQNGTATMSRPSVWFTPRFDIYENENEYVLLGDLPGVNPADLDLKYENQELTIHGKVASRCHGAGNCFAEEYGVGDFRRSFSIGDLIDGSQIAAELKDGVLTVHLPKRAEAKPRKIEVRSA
jgi:HSP20 family protein